MAHDIASTMQQLYAQFGELPGVTIELHKELIAISVVNQAATATVFLQGAQLSHYQLPNQHPIIWCSDLCDYSEGQSLRGGIPVCWPWFGDLNRNPDKLKQQVTGLDAPAHGFVRKQIWQLDNVQILNDKTTQLVLSLAVRKNEQ
ncbi:MAG: hypothetical protein V7711_03060, partial [Pseudomonadales bacterium]